MLRQCRSRGHARTLQRPRPPSGQVGGSRERVACIGTRGHLVEPCSPERLEGGGSWINSSFHPLLPRDLELLVFTLSRLRLIGSPPIVTVRRPLPSGNRRLWYSGRGRFSRRPSSLLACCLKLFAPYGAQAGGSQAKRCQIAPSPQRKLATTSLSQDIPPPGTPGQDEVPCEGSRSIGASGCRSTRALALRSAVCGLRLRGS